MSCSPEQSRLNAQKSTGPKTERGKAIVSQNGKTHGLLCQDPPLLATEEREHFRDLLTDLCQHYQPDGPVERHLVYQIAMAMQKQLRVWRAEVAIQNAQLLPDPPALPIREALPLTDKQFQQLSPKHVQYLKALVDEQTHLQHLLMVLDEDYLVSPLDFYAERQAMTLAELTAEREEAEAYDGLAAWPPIWENTLFYRAESSQPVLKVFHDQYPLSALPEELSSHDNPNFYSAINQPDRQQRHRAAQLAHRRLLDEKHPYVLLIRVLDQAQLWVATWNSKENIYPQIQRPSLKRLKRPVDQDAQQIITTWQADPYSDYLKTRAEQFYRSLVELREAIVAKLEQHQALSTNLQIAQQLDRQRQEFEKEALPASLQLVNRYESHINRELHQAIAKLMELQQVRQPLGSKVRSRTVGTN